MIKLYKHNQKTYKNIIKLFAGNKRVACVQPTGTGKSFIMLKLIEDNPDKKFLITSPSVYIFEQIRTHAKDSGVDISNCEFFTYQKIIYMDCESIRRLEADYIITDEFHRLGSPEWGGKGMECLLSTHENSKVLGTSATPVRYLDCMRNMAEEMFDSCYAVNMNLSEAINKKILPLPVYVTAWYSFSDEIAKLEKRAVKTNNPYLKERLHNEILKARSKITDIDCGLEKVLKKHIRNKNGKYIMFCPSCESIETSRQKAHSWFRYVNKNIHIYSVYTYGDDIKNQFENFKNDKSDDAMKLLLCIDMLNEGVHVEGIDGVIMLRATRSANIFYQQLGRALSCSNSKPVIFDLVNNYETGDTAEEYASIMEIGRNGLPGEKKENISFEIYDYVRDVRTLLDDIYNTFEQSWEITFEMLKKFTEEKNRFPDHGDIYEGYNVAAWCTVQRVLYNKNKLSEDKIKKLENIGFVWDKKEDNWNRNFNLLKEFRDNNGEFPGRRDSLKNEAVRSLYLWSLTQKERYMKGRMTEERIAKLSGIGFDLIIRSDDELWEDKYSLLKEFYLKYGRFPLKSDIDSGKLKISYSWIITQRKKFKEGKLSAEQIEKLNAVGFVWCPEEERWNYKFGKLRNFVYEKGRIPKTTEDYCGFDIGQWYAKQFQYLCDEKLSDDRAEKIRSLDVMNILITERKWLSRFDSLTRFVNKNHRLPYSGEVFEGFNLYNWINKQKDKLKNGKLDDEHLKRFESLNIDLINFCSDKTSETVSRRWIDMYGEYKEFVSQNRRLPKRGTESEGRLYRWRRRQISALENGKLNDEQKGMLTDIGFK